MNRRVLVVEDDLSVARALVQFLKGTGWTATDVRSPDEIDEAQLSADVILTGSAGSFEVIRRALRPVVIYTASDPGFAGVVVVKPTQSTDMITALEFALQEKDQ